MHLTAFVWYYQTTRYRTAPDSAFRLQYACEFLPKTSHPRDAQGDIALHGTGRTVDQLINKTLSIIDFLVEISCQESTFSA
jgi:hypothetical protein